MKNRIRIWTLIFAAVICTPPTAINAETVTFTSNKDNTLYEDTGGSLSNGAGDHLFVGMTASALKRRALLSFDVSSIPSGAVVTGVRLTLNMSTSVAGQQVVTLHRLLGDWGEGNYYPHVASDNLWWTGIVAYNPSVSECTITITPYNIQGEALASSIRTLAAKEKFVGVVSDLGLPAETVWFKIDSTSPLTGFELFGTLDDNRLAAYAGGGGTGATEGVFAKIEKNGWTGIAFVNTEAAAASVTLTAYTDNGTVVTTQAFSVAGFAKEVRLAEEFFSQSIANATYIAYSSDRNVVGFQLNGSTDDRMLDGLPSLGGTN